MTPLAEHLARQRSHELAGLRWHWAGAYIFSWADGLYRARRADDGTELAATTAPDLRDRCRADYLLRPVPREPGGR